jgi:SAM-dependent methyltransferase
VYLRPDQRPTPLQEVLRYQEHRNNFGDEQYVQFLRRLADPLREKLAPGARGLDFGCGPQRVLAGFLSDNGFPTASYDPLFYPDAAVLDATYDFVACSEVLEHVHDPRKVLEQIAWLLRNGGTLGVMTRFHGIEAPFATWWYRRDSTHVCFYSEATMRWIAGSRDWTVAFPAPHVSLFSVGPLAQVSRNPDGGAVQHSGLREFPGAR